MGSTGKNWRRRRSSRLEWERRAVTGITQEIRALDPLVQRKYLRDFRDAFQTYQCAITPAQFDEELLEAEVILIGDYHTLAASQGYAAHLVAHAASRGKAASLGLEAIFAADQPVLDDWSQNKITEQQLRSSLRFDQEWGYDWEPVCELLHTAHHHAVPVYGLDCGPRSNLRAIRKRDLHAAAKIAEIRERFPRRSMMALFGESHLAPSHLPALVRAQRPQDRILTILQNCDALYWQLAVGPAGNKPVVRISAGVLGVFTASLFEKYDSYRAYLQGEPEEFGPLFPAVDKNL